MAFSWQESVEPSGTQNIQCDIEYLDKSYIHVYLDGAEVTAFTWTSATNIRLDTPLSQETVVLLIRKTEREYLYIEFASGAPFIEGNVDTQNTQFLHLAQELVEGRYIEGFYGDINMHRYRITNLGDPVDARDAASKQYVDSGDARLDQRIDAEAAVRAAADAALDSRTTALESSFLTNPKIVYPWFTVLPYATNIITPGFSFDVAEVYVQGICQVPGYSYSITSGTVTFSEVLPAGTLVYMRVGVNVGGDPNNVATMLQLLSSNEAGYGAALVALAGRGTAQDLAVTVKVNSYGGDSSGTLDSSAAVVAAANAIRLLTDSAYVFGTTAFGRVEFASGTYMLGDVPLFSGIIYAGQGEWATRIKPKAGASYCFTSTGVTPATSTPLKRLFNAGIEGMSIGCAYYDDLDPIPAGVGGVYLAYASYFVLRDVSMRRLNGVGLDLVEAWDMDFDNLRMMYVGNNTVPAAPVPALRMSMGSGNDGCNALRFRGLHMEACPKAMDLQPGCRHVFFLGAKLESGTVSSTITGAAGISFANCEFTWARNDVPQFLISRTSSYESFGVLFTAPQFINGGTSPRGWMIHHTSDAGHLLISDFSAKNVDKLITGNSFKVEGGVAYSCGPNFINSTWNSYISGLVCRAIQATSTAGPAATDGTGDFIILSGGAQSIRNCHFNSNGSVSDGLAYVNITGASGDVECHSITWSGSRQYGVRNTVNTYRIRDNATVDGGSIGSVLSSGTPRYTLVNVGTSGFGAGGVSSASVTIAAAASGNLALVAGGTLILLRTSAALGPSSAVVFVDANSAAVALLASTGGVFATGTGTPGDGKVYISRTGTNLVLTNYSSSAATFYGTAVSAVL